jgi:3-deoxy-D-manno-octulosonate 8-phosphate phosphatase (KDO 8-P phosphatase)
LNKSIKLFLTDIDGVWTDGGMYYNENGSEFKKFNTSDSAGVLFCHLLDINVGIITGENSQIVKHRADKLKIKYYFLGVNDKVRIAKNLIKELGISWQEVAYIGDDINDIQLLKKVGLSACPINSPEYIKEVVNWVIPIEGGDGAFRYFVEKYLKQNDLLKTALNKYLRQKKFEQ